MGSRATGRGNYRHVVFLMAIGVGNKKKLGKRAGVGAFGSNMGFSGGLHTHMGT